MPDGPERDYMEWLWIKYHRFMFSVAWKTVKSRSDAEDVVSESTVKLCEKVETLQTLNQYQLTTYISNTVWTTGVQYTRKKHGVVPIDLSEWQFPDSLSAETNNKIALREELELVLSKVRELPPKERDTLRLKYKTDLSNKEIAEIVGLSEDSVRKYLSRARRKLLAMLYRDGE